MPSASAAQVEKTIALRHDGAVICKHRMTRGKCNKLLVTEDGELRCNNGHKTPISDAFSQALNDPRAGWKVISQFGRHASDVGPLIRRLASSEFLNASSDTWQHDLLLRRLDIFADILPLADLYEPECGRALREYWERKLPEFWPDIATYLGVLKKQDTTRYIRFRERALLAFQRWGTRDPLRYLVWSELSLEATEGIGSDRRFLYKHNIEESARLLTSGQRFPTPALLYFHRHHEHDFTFMAMPDPYWSDRGWRFDQIRIKLQWDKSSGQMVRMKVQIANDDQSMERNFERRFEDMKRDMAQASPKPDTIYTGHSGKISINLSRNWNVDFTDPKFHLEVIRYFVGALLLRMDTLTQT